MKNLKCKIGFHDWYSVDKLDVEVTHRVVALALILLLVSSISAICSAKTGNTLIVAQSVISIGFSLGVLHHAIDVDKMHEERVDKICLRCYKIVPDATRKKNNLKKSEHANSIRCEQVKLALKVFEREIDNYAEEIF